MSLIFLFLSNHEAEIEEEEDAEKLKKKCEVWWGLSDSSTNLAKELLPSEFVTVSPMTSFIDDKVSGSQGLTVSASHSVVAENTITVKPEGATALLSSHSISSGTTAAQDAETQIVSFRIL